MAEKLTFCDTDVLIDYWDSTAARHQQTKHILENVIKLDNVVISAITKMELLMGASNKSEQNKISNKLLRFHTALINEDISMQAMTLFEEYRLSHGMAIPDCIIAASALTIEMKLFTYNLKDYRFIKELKLMENSS